LSFELAALLALNALQGGGQLKTENSTLKTDDDL
jgi:hypothetical protein